MPPPATPPAPTAQTVAKAAGDAQTAAPNNVLATAPAVTVRDAAGTAMAGVDVSFAVTSGGGRIENASARTDAAGRASAGVWTLGAGQGTQRLTATVSGLAPVVFTAVAANAATNLTVSVLAPATALKVGEGIDIIAGVISANELRSVVARVNDKTVALTYGSWGRGFMGWGGRLPVVGVPSGPIELVITATDYLGRTTDAVVPLTLDRPPAISMPTPLNEAIARPTVQLNVTCTDDAATGCLSFTVRASAENSGGQPVVVASGKDSFSGPLDLSAFEGKVVKLFAVAADNGGQTSTVERTVNVESSAKMALRTEVEGAVWDASGARTLFLDSSGAVPALKLRDGATAMTQTIESGPDLGVSGFGGYGFITPVGALYVHSRLNAASPYSWLYEWRAGTLTTVAGLNSSNSLRVAGDWAIYNDDSGFGQLLRRLNVRTGGSETVATNAGNNSNDVAANGTVAYWTMDYKVHRWNGSTPVTLTSDATLLNTYPVTDGINVVYRKHTACCSGTTWQIAMHDGSKETILTPTPSTTEPLPDRSYAARGGWVAYVSTTVASSRQVWRYGPPGTQQQLTFFGTSSTIDAIGEDGTVLLSHEGRRYRAVAGSTTLTDVGSSLGRVVWRDGRFLVLLGRSVFEILP